MLGRNGPDAVNSSDYSSPLLVFNKMSFLTEETEENEWRSRGDDGDRFDVGHQKVSQV